MNRDIHVVLGTLFLGLGLAASYTHATPCDDSYSKADVTSVETYQPRIWVVGRDTQSIERDLNQTKILRLIPMDEFQRSQGKTVNGTSEIYLAELESGLRAVFKIDPDGFDSLSEVSAFRVSEFLGLELIPPTVARMHEGRLGSFQLYVRTSRDLAVSNKVFQKAFSEMSEKHQSDVKILNFILGRWDDHSGQMLIDDANWPVLLDSADCHNHSQVQYGEFPYVRRGKRRALKNAPDPGPFPFDHPQKLVNPSLKELEAAFHPYSKGSWIARLHEKVERSIPGKTINYAIWDGMLWVSTARTWRSPAYTNVYSRRTLAALQRLNQENVKDYGIPGLLERTQQVLEASKSGRLIP